MILQSLHTLYQRLASDSKYNIAPAGYSTQKVSFAVVLEPDGQLHDIVDVQESIDGKLRPLQLLLPGQAKPSGSGLNPCFLWDNTLYLLGYTNDDNKRGRALPAFEAFRDRHLKLEAEINDEGFSAVCRFLENWQPERDADAAKLDEFGTGFGVFRLQGATEYIHKRNAIRDWWARSQEVDLSGSAGGNAMCLITGERAPAALLHEPAIKGVAGAQSSGAKVVSFNCDAFTSYGKEQSHNAPVSEAAAFRYCTALNALLNGPRHRFGLADTTVVFWTGKPTVVEEFLGHMFAGNLSEEIDESEEAQNPAKLKDIQVLLHTLREGGRALEHTKIDTTIPVYLLGVSPNAARLSVRFWHEETIGSFFDGLKRHFDDLRIIRQFEEGAKRPDPEFPAPWMLLRETARESKDISPLLAGALMRAILKGTPYPDALAGAIVRRIRADHRINYLRAAMLKAWLNRLPQNRTQGELPVSLDTERPEPAYRLGRLFAALEKTQQDALGDVNASIRDKFYSAASATPSTVFPRILRTYQHHLGKLSVGARIHREQLVQEICDRLDGMPSHLNLEEQALFAIGYYHQRKALFTKKADKETPTEPTIPTTTE